MAHMRGWQGQVYYNNQPAGKGNPVHPTLPIGYWENVRPRIIGGVEPIFAAGTREYVDAPEGMTGVEWSADIAAIQGLLAQRTFLNQGITTATGLVDYMTLGFGWIPDPVAGPAAADQRIMDDNKIDSLAFSGDNEGNFSCSLTGFGGKVATNAGAVFPVQSQLADASLQMHEAVFQLYELSSIRVEVRHNLEMKPVIAGPATVRDPGRIWDYLTEGLINCSGTLGMFNKAAGDLQANCITSGTRTLTFTQKCSPGYQNTWILTMQNLKPQDETLTLPGPDADIEWEIPFICTNMTLTGTGT